MSFLLTTKEKRENTCVYVIITHIYTYSCSMYIFYANECRAILLGISTLIVSFKKLA
jgi:hypothetical protein